MKADARETNLKPRCKYSITPLVPVLVLYYVRSRAQRVHLCCVCVYTNGDPCVQTLRPRSGGLHLFGQQN